MNHAPHLSEEQLVDAFYHDLDSASAHLEQCSECRARLDRLRETLDSVARYPVPPRDASYGAAVWTRLLPQLPPERAARSWLRWWMLAPALASVLLLAFLTGRLVERTRVPGISPQARERVLLMSLSDHLDQSQIVLANVANADTESPDLAYERDRAHELLGANRLLRQTAVRLGDAADAALLDDLERSLLVIANGPRRPRPGDLLQTQRQITQEGLLFRVRVTSTAAREKGEKL